jgi:hypothetical protein
VYLYVSEIENLEENKRNDCFNRCKEDNSKNNNRRKECMNHILDSLEGQKNIE